MLQLVAGGLQPITNEVIVSMRFRLVENIEKEIVDFQLNSNYNIVEDLERSFIETEEFRRTWKSLKYDDKDLQELQNIILTKSPEANLGANCYKIRFVPSDMDQSKRKTSRVVYVDYIEGEQIILLGAFEKSAKSNLTDAELRKVKKYSNMVRRNVA